MKMEIFQQAYRKFISEVTTTPVPLEMPYFDPMYGFPEGRPVLEPPVSKEELIAGQVHRNRRDVCAVDWMRFKDCQKNSENVFTSGCNLEKEIFQRCAFAEQVVRAKEYERERRLLKRRERILNKMAKEAAKEKLLQAE